jgi:hypothetical protein
MEMLKLSKSKTNSKKIFCIGLSRTGTKSLTTALSFLGFKSAHWDYTKKIIAYHKTKIKINFNKIDNFEALADIPIARIYKELDKHYSSSKFILTVRDNNSWLQSIIRHFNKKFGKSETNKIKKLISNPTNTNKLIVDIYGKPPYGPKQFKEAHKKHITSVLKYFSGRPEDLLVINICGGDSWNKLCPFLGREVPKYNFPWIKG